jgi:hypothetical protein
VPGSNPSPNSQSTNRPGRPDSDRKATQRRPSKVAVKNRMLARAEVPRNTPSSPAVATARRSVRLAAARATSE